MFKQKTNKSKTGNIYIYIYYIYGRLEAGAAGAPLQQAPPRPRHPGAIVISYHTISVYDMR